MMLCNVYKMLVLMFLVIVIYVITGEVGQVGMIILMSYMKELDNDFMWRDDGKPRQGPIGDLDLTRFNKIATQGTPQMAVD